jgi:hypothetical protein
MAAAAWHRFFYNITFSTHGTVFQYVYFIWLKFLSSEFLKAKETLTGLSPSSFNLEDLIEHTKNTCQQIISEFFTMSGATTKIGPIPLAMSDDKNLALLGRSGGQEVLDPAPAREACSCLMPCCFHHLPFLTSIIFSSLQLCLCLLRSS